MIRQRKPIRRKTETQRKKIELSKLIRAYVIEKAGNRCEYCGATENLQAAHILSVGAHRRLQFEPYNILCLCVKDHIFGWHKDPDKYLKWVDETFPGRRGRLRIADRCAPKVDVELLLLIWRQA